MKKLSIILFSILSSSFFNLSNAQTWDSLGSGTNYQVQTFTSYYGNLIAGGDFDTAGGVPVTYIAQWNGHVWDSVGINYMVDVVAICTYDTELYAEDLNNLAPLLGRWNGNTWSAVPGLPPFGTPQYLWALLVYNGKLYVGGQYAQINNISSWDNSKWDTLMNGTNGTVLSLGQFNGNLYAGGGFDSAGRIPAKNIAVWNGTLWNNVGKGINGPVYALTVFNNNLYAGGKFDSAGGMPAKNIAAWNGSNWSPVGIGVSNSVYALTVYGSVMIAGGIFDTAGGTICNKIAQWDGSTWSALNGGVTGNYVDALFNDNSILYVGGDFTKAGTISANNVAQWKSPLGINKLTNNNGSTIFPNPSSGIFTLSVSNVNEKCNVEIYNVLGESVLTETLHSAQGDKVIDLTKQPNGVYFYRVISEDGDFLGSGKMVVDK